MPVIVACASADRTTFEVQRAGRRDRVGVAAAAGDQTGVFLADAGLADLRLGDGGHWPTPAVAGVSAGAPGFIFCAAPCTARTMFW